MYEVLKNLFKDEIAAEVAAAEDFIRTETEARVRRESETRIRETETRIKELEAEIARLRKNN